MKFIPYILVFFTFGCVTHGKRWVELSGRHNVITKDFFDPEITSPRYEMQDGKLAGTGGQFAIITISDFFYTRLSYYMAQLKADEFTYTDLGTPVTYRDLKADTSGFDADLGFKIWHFYPYITATYTNIKFKNNDPALNNLLPDTNFLFTNHISQLGGGLAMDIPLGSRLSLFFNARILQDQQSYSAGIIFGGWDFGDPNASRRESSSRKKR